MRLPVIDYDAHPAYAPCPEQIRAERAEVVRAAHAEARNLVAERLGDHLFRPSAPGTGMVNTLSEHGVVPLQLDAGSNQSLLGYVDERIEQLKLAGEASLQIALAPGCDDGGAGRIGAICLELIRSFDLLAIAKTQLAAETLYVKASLRYSTPENAAFQRQTIADFPDPATVGLHFDVPTNSIKLTLFVSEVEGLEAGAFGYIPGSHRRDLDDSLDRIATHILCKQDWIDEPIDSVAGRLSNCGSATGFSQEHKKLPPWALSCAFLIPPPMIRDARSEKPCWSSPILGGLGKARGFCHPGDARCPACNKLWNSNSGGCLALE